MQESFSSSQKGLPHRDLTLVRHMLYLYNGAMELMAPAGDLQSAYQALTHGADAVYLGLQDYSARRSATNFSIEELRRLKSYALEHGKAIYVTMNTIIKDDELAGVLQMLHHLALIAVDGIIVQDLGLAGIIRTHFPSIGLHGSTQLAVHTVSGVRYLQSIGFTRVVLARELTIEEITHIRKTCPEVELKVFIHGALCYGFSGLCLASSAILHRSGNRGACGQICRTWSTLIEEDGQPSAAERNGFFFSMKDLASDHDILSLRAIGIDALKIEGRMKSPSFTASTTRFYHDILTGSPEDPTPSQIAFSREQTAGWTTAYHRPDTAGIDSPLISTDFPGHTGVPAGSIEKIDRRRVLIRLSVRISLRDGLMVLSPDREHPGLKSSRSFGVTGISDQHGRRCTTGEPGSRVWIDTAFRLTEADTLHKVSSHDQELPLVNPASLSLSRYRLTADFFLEQTTCTMTACIPEIGWEFSHSMEITVHEAENPKDILPILTKVFASSNHELPLQIVSLRLHQHTDQDIFIQQKELKRIKHTMYDRMTGELNDFISERSTAIARTSMSPAAQSEISLPARSQIGRKLCCIDGIWYLPLDPVQFDEQAHTRLWEQQIRELRERDPHAVIVIGLNSIGQIPWYQEQQGLFCYIDTYLYCANRYTACTIAQGVKGCIGAYYWLEDTDPPKSFPAEVWGLPMTAVDRSFQVPIFISRTCFRRDSLAMPCSSCAGRSHTYKLAQQGRTFTVEVRDCMSYVYLDH